MFIKMWFCLSCSHKKPTVYEQVLLSTWQIISASNCLDIHHTRLRDRKIPNVPDGRGHQYFIGWNVISVITDCQTCFLVVVLTDIVYKLTTAPCSCPGCSSASSSWTDTDWSGHVLTIPNGFSQEPFEKRSFKDAIEIKFQEFSCLLMSVGLWNRQSTAILSDTWLTVWLWCLLCRGGCSRSVCRRWFPSEKKSLLIPAIVKFIMITVFFGTAPTWSTWTLSGIVWLLSMCPHSAIWGFWSVVRRNFSHQDGPQVKELLQQKRKNTNYVILSADWNNNSSLGSDNANVQPQTFI